MENTEMIMGNHGFIWVYMGLYPLVVQHTYGKIDEDGPFIDV